LNEVGKGMFVTVAVWRRTGMGRGATAATVGAACVVGGGAMVAGRRRKQVRRDRRPPGGEVAVQGVTVLGDGQPVRAAWETHVQSADLPPVRVEVRPAPGERGTEVLAHVEAGTDRGGDGAPRATGLGKRVAGEAPDQRLRAELRRFKSKVETGTIVTTEGQPTGRGPVREALTRAVTDRLRAWGTP
jgi:hypothetical protein